MTPAVVAGIVTGMTDLATITRMYWIAVQRVRRLAVPARDKVLVLADLEVICRRAWAAREAMLLSRAATLAGQGGK